MAPSASLPSSLSSGGNNKNNMKGEGTGNSNSNKKPLKQGNLFSFFSKSVAAKPQSKKSGSSKDANANTNNKSGEPAALKVSHEDCANPVLESVNNALKVLNVQEDYADGPQTVAQSPNEIDVPTVAIKELEDALQNQNLSQRADRVDPKRW